MKTYLKFFLIPIFLFIIVYVIPTGVSFLINSHSNIANLLLLLFVSGSFGIVSGYLYNKFNSNSIKEITNED